MRKARTCIFRLVRFHAGASTVKSSKCLERESGPEEVLEMLRPLARNEVLDAFVESCDEDFAYSTCEGFRFRVNLLRDHNGISAVFRYIPGEISSLEALGCQKF